MPPRKVEIANAHYDGSMYKAKATFKEDGIYYIKTELMPAVNTSFLLSKSQ